ncbi:MAG: glycogen-debranching protein [Verrucomicrobiota bacterium]|nr:glycogen-debranching protein [Verrucomicrobiota bacterium]
MLDHIEISAGSPSRLGLSYKDGTWFFALFSSHAKEVFLGLFLADSHEALRLIPLHRSGDVWHIALKNVPAGTEYAYQCRGEWNEKAGNLFDEKKWLADPYALALSTSPVWNKPTEKEWVRAPIFQLAPFDWGHTKRPRLAKEDLIIYEMHVRGFTVHPSSGVQAPGTFAGLIEKIPYLKELGITAIEIMPIFEFDERHSKNIHPDTNESLPNYWGYNSVSFFALKRSFASDPTIQGALSEFKTFVKELHKEGIELYLDVVYNHTGEGKEKDYAISWRGIDNQVYYMVDAQGTYRDYTGCGNTCNVNHPVVQKLILDSLRYWVLEMGVDGFRFDLASILTRGTDGKPLSNPPLIQAMANDPDLSRVKLIAEAWDAAGLYQLGTFPKWGPWSEWNGRFRDIVRRFIKGTEDKAGLFGIALSGCDFLYFSSNTPLSSINFITAHDGFSLRDLVTYQDKHNWENGEKNLDGNDQNDNWNCGMEGPTDHADITALRERQMRNFFLALFVSQGIPLLLMGDEYGHTRDGNNNPYVQDNERNWFLWDQLATSPIFPFVRDLIAFRKAHPVLRKTHFLTDKDVAWHGHLPNQPDWNTTSQFVAFSTKTSPSLYIAFNASSHPATVQLPPGPWKLVVNTNDPWDKHHFLNPGPQLPSFVTLVPYSSMIAIQ